MDILRFITAGSVDNGKSTLIGRLLYDTKNILADQMNAIEKASKSRNNGEIDLALLTDGLRSEREQGITIDVAYKYFQTANRKFISIDAPGHLQYTRNMVTGASNADLAIILVDARLGVIEQTKRHSLIAGMLKIPYVIVAINKMDLVDFSEDTFLKIAADYRELADKLKIENLKIIPVSALNGDNIVDKSPSMPWYQGETLLSVLETADVHRGAAEQGARFPVQFVLRPQTSELHDYRGYAGRLISGKLRKGDRISALPSGSSSVIAGIEVYGKEVDEIVVPQSATILLEDDIDISRGDILTAGTDQPVPTQDVKSLICWMDDRKELKPGNKYLLQHGTSRVRCSVKQIDYRIDINSYVQEEGVEALRLNDVASVLLRTAQPIAFDPYSHNRANGGAILIDETSNVTVGACMLEEV
ncbi:GTP-binding protein [Ravibacter arvi]|uniref:sulfate adenylyltransferase n=1 Tax=Ravibacter arvi TaxID=2051041 RepID=A0ABP8LN83_9BACT